ncbi:PAS domain-containing sensor histidine kinase [Natronocalculus amylovorans]|uniref:histidine kinase n=1 Tax=Natronocalculus amylovorans TaxID=2917812 RepID=A0AAE3FWS4_9EURY|nr:PAS domain-containing sensor histidine kinase [Natronocalculus amylovorans]MCL9816676.1 PAS domain-containing sensor histidine kinase [Natronocalculus amylovorans]NUE01119.1 PAS domain-containing sensor histidine kinase [Halorubraceae archaeon YAN]
MTDCSDEQLPAETAAPIDRAHLEYMRLVENMHDVCVLVEIEGAPPTESYRICRSNQYHKTVTGWTETDIRGESPTTLYGKEIGSDVIKNYRRCIAAREPIEYEADRLLDGELETWNIKLSPVIEHDRVTHLVVVARQVTGKKQERVELERERKRLDELVHLIAHDLRSPLNVAQGYADLLEEPRTGGQDSDYLEQVQGALDRIDTIISETITLVKQGNTVNDVDAVGLSSIARTSWKMVETEDATLTVDIDSECSIVCDYERTKHVFENLFRNAVEHAGPAPTITVGQQSDEGFYIADNGSGIPKKHRETVFLAGVSIEGSTGFGLSIVKWIATAHGWDVDIEESNSGGARFEFTNVTIE